MEGLTGYGQEPAIATADAKQSLASLGVRVEGSSDGARVFFANSSSALASAFERTDWRRSWSTTIARADGASKSPQAKYGALTSRGVCVPYRVFSPVA